MIDEIDTFINCKLISNQISNCKKFAYKLKLFEKLDFETTI